MVDASTTNDVRIWSITKIPRKGAGQKNSFTYQVRWKVGGRRRSANYVTAALADSERSALLTAARNGEAFDIETGLPISRRESALPEVVSWWSWALEFVELKWPTLLPNSRLSVSEALTTATIALLAESVDEPTAVRLRAAMMQWSFVISRRRPGGADRDCSAPEEHRESIEYLASHTVALADLEDVAVIRRVLERLSSRLDGRRAAVSTAARKRGVFFNALEMAVESGKLKENAIRRVRRSPSRAVHAINLACVVNPSTARKLLAAVAKVGDGTRDRPATGNGASRVKSYREPQGAPLLAFFACMYYAGLRPSEAAALRIDDLELLEDVKEWGMLRLSRNDPEITSAWTDSGKREAGPLKHRGKGTVRPVPCPPVLAEILRAHIRDYGVHDDGRLFYGPKGGYIKESVYTEVWQCARVRALPAAEAASSLAARPYDLRHSCVSTWLAAGVDTARIAEWVGHSVAVLHKVYAHALPGRDHLARGLIAKILAPEKEVPARRRAHIVRTKTTDAS